MDLTRSAKTLV